MRKRLPAVIAASAAALTLVAGPAPARPAGARVHSLEYTGGGLIVGSTRSTAVRVGDAIGAVEFRGGPERFVSIEIADAHGQPVTGVVVQPDGDEETHVCGATEKPVKVRPYENVTVFLMNGTCGDSGASVVTTGTVTATFTKR